MKYLQILITIILIVSFASCKKVYQYTQADLIGIWTEQQPYIFNNGHFVLQFNANDTVVEIEPDTSVTQYKLMGNNTIQLNNCLPYGYGSTGSASYQISGDANDITVINFVERFNSTPTWLNLNLKKN